MTKAKHDLNLHIALIGLSISILSLVGAITFYIAKLDSSVDNNTTDINDIKVGIHEMHEDVQGLRLDMTEIAVKLGTKQKDLRTVAPTKVATTTGVVR